MVEPTTGTIRAQYVGPMTLNTRTLEQGLALLLGTDGTSRDRLTMDDVATVLSLLEAVAMGDVLFYDGTVPRRTREPVAELVDELHQAARTVGAKRRIKPLEPDAEALLGLIAEAATQGAPLLRDMTLAAVKQRSEPPVPPEEADAFVAALERTAGARGTARRQAAAELAGSELRGGKALAGLLLADTGGSGLDVDVQQLFHRHSSTTERCYLVAGVINRFRTNYLNALSAGERAAYLANPRIEGLKRQQVLLLWRYLSRRVAERTGAELAFPEDGFRTEFQAFPLGFALLMSRRRAPADPRELLLGAITEGRSLTNRHLHRAEASQQRFLHELSDEEFAALEDDHFGDLVDRIERPGPASPSLVLRSARLALPVVVGVGTAMAGDVGLGAVGASGTHVLIDLLSEHGPDAVGRFLGNVEGRTARRERAYRDTYQHMRELLEQAMSNTRDPARVVGRIEQVFGRPLVT